MPLVAERSAELDASWELHDQAAIELRSVAHRYVGLSGLTDALAKIDLQCFEWQALVIDRAPRYPSAGRAYGYSSVIFRNRPTPGFKFYCKLVLGRQHLEVPFGKGRANRKAPFRIAISTEFDCSPVDRFI